jgi:hypothetical protein
MPDNLPTNSDAAKRKFLPEATSNFPIAKVVKTVVSDPSPSDVEKLATSPAIKEEDIVTDDEGLEGCKLPSISVVKEEDIETDDEAGNVSQMTKMTSPDALERNKSAFHLYSNATTDNVKVANPDAKFGEIAHIFSRHFKGLSKKSAPTGTKRRRRTRNAMRERWSATVQQSVRLQMKRHQTRQSPRWPRRWSGMKKPR